MIENDSFEILLEEYKTIAEKLNDNDIKLEEAVNLYEKSNILYKKLNKSIENAKLKINNIREENV